MTSLPEQTAKKTLLLSLLRHPRNRRQIKHWSLPLLRGCPLHSNGCKQTLPALVAERGHGNTPRATFVITRGVEDANYIGRKLEEEYEKWGL
jgi:hypothetical protein